MDSSIFFSKKAYEITRSASFRKGMYESALHLSVLHEKTNQSEALRYYKQTMAHKDTMFDTQKTVRALQARYTLQIQHQEAEKTLIQNKNKVWKGSLFATTVVFVLISLILYRNKMISQNAKVKIQKAYEQLQFTQTQLVQSEKMASLGELTAGIAHEIQNPLNFVNNFSEVNSELINELKNEMDEKNETAIQLLDTLKDNGIKILQHGKRADAIV